MTGISVLTLVKNRSDHLANLIEGVRRSTLVPDELVIVDMSDEPVAVETQKLPVRLIRLPNEGLPLATARNRAAEAAHSPLLLFLDVDCIPLAPMIGAVATLLEHEDTLVCAEVRYLAAGGAQQGWTDASLLAAGRPHPVRDFPTAGVRTEANAGLFWSLAFGMRRSRFDEIGGFDEQFVGYGAEDTDFGFRAASAGIPLRFLGGAIACHQHHSVYDPPLQHFADITRNAGLFHKRWGRWPMEGWLNAFSALGLIAYDGHQLKILRFPSPEMIERAFVS